MVQNLSKMFAIYNLTGHRLIFFPEKIIKQDLISAQGVNVFKNN